LTDAVTIGVDIPEELVAVEELLVGDPIMLQYL